MGNNTYFVELRAITCILDPGEGVSCSIYGNRESIIIDPSWVVVALSLPRNQDSLLSFQEPIIITDV